MEKFDYYTEKFSSEFFGRNSKKETEHLKDRGQRGWELVGVVSVSLGNATVYYWKRKII